MKVLLHYKAEKEFNKLTLTQKNKVLQQFVYLNKFGSVREIPETKKIKGTNMWEIRILGRDNLRLIYKVINNSIVVLHIFVKKSNKTPNKNIQTAINRLKSIVSVD